MKTPVFVLYDWVLFKKYGLDVVELVGLYLGPLMKTSGSISERIHSAKTVKNPLFS